MSAVAVPLVDVAEIAASVNALADMEAAIVRRLTAASRRQARPIRLWMCRAGRMTRRATD